jgi:hypothetical protein
MYKYYLERLLADKIANGDSRQSVYIHGRIGDKTLRTIRRLLNDSSTETNIKEVLEKQINRLVKAKDFFLLGPFACTDGLEPFSAGAKQIIDQELSFKTIRRNVRAICETYPDCLCETVSPDPDKVASYDRSALRWLAVIFAPSFLTVTLLGVTGFPKAPVQSCLEATAATLLSILGLIYMTDGLDRLSRADDKGPSERAMHATKFVTAAYIACELTFTAVFYYYVVYPPKSQPGTGFFWTTPSTPPMFPGFRVAYAILKMTYVLMFLRVVLSKVLLPEELTTKRLPVLFLKAWEFIK